MLGAVRFRHEVLLAARLELEMTQEEAAQSLGVDVRTYRRYETGDVNEGGFDVRRASRRALLERMGRELGLGLGQLLDDGSGAAHHVLQPAPHFVGRGDDLSALARFRASGRPGVCAIVGVGGSGKTALVERFLADRPDDDRAAVVFSFYEDRRVEPFLTLARGLQTPGRVPLIVLDGLEVHQVVYEDARAHGELRDLELQKWLRAVAAERVPVQVITTTRLPLPDLAPFVGRGYTALELAPLGEPDVQALLDAWGVPEPGSLAPLARGHALSAAVLGSYVGGFLGGDRAALEGLSLTDAAADDALARRLDAVLGSYRAALPDDTVGALDRLAAQPAGAPLSRWLPEPAERVHLRRLVRLGLVFAQGDGRYAAHPFVRDFFRAAAEAGAPSLELPPGAPASSVARLDALEARFTEALDDDRVLDAWLLYRDALGGFDHLGLVVGALARGRRLLAQLAPRLDAAGLSPNAAAGTVYEQGLYASTLGELDHAIACYDRVLGYAEASASMHATALRATGYAHRLRGDSSAALGALAASAELAMAHELHGHVGKALALRGAVLGDVGSYREANASFARSESFAGPMKLRRALWRAELDLWLGDVDAARTRAEEQRAECARRGWAGHVAHCEAVLGFAALRDGASDPAEHLAVLKSWGETSGEAEMLARMDALEHCLDPASGARERSTDRPSTRPLVGLYPWFRFLG